MAAYEKAKNIAENPQLYHSSWFYGKANVGKTHLRLAIEGYIKRQRPEIDIISISALELSSRIIAYIRNGDTDEMRKFQDKYRDADIFMLDDFDFVIGKEILQRETIALFHTRLDEKKSVIVFSRNNLSSIRELDIKLYDLFWKDCVELKLPEKGIRTNDPSEEGYWKHKALDGD